ncbi:uncharacterized protein LOC105385700 [Plutella xylostella]|uniref:uncharacterized protein LOC105385700 n=1 Tax=Plutella xylostella TaxID=51655 RepID=UPI002032B6D8|nr:uncharacterized protein LOC105385700 [Plutella xylostella]
MTPIVFLMMLVVSRAAAEVVELSCSDNATCIDGLAKEFVRSIREQKTVRLFDVLTIEPLQRRQARSSQGLLSRFLSGHAFSFDWNDFQFRLSRPEQRSDAMELEVFESRGARDLAEPVPKKTGTVGTTKDAGEEEKRPKRLKGNRRQRKKVLQALIPMMFGMKSAGTVMFAMAVVTALTLKAFVASKLALMVTVGMALKRLYESYGNGVGLQNHPYLYSQYPVDFPSASSHAYSVSGVSPNFASPEMYNPTALSAHPHAHEMLQQGDASAQQSQQQPTLQLVNNTRATERWDGFRRRPMFYGPSRATSESYSGYQDYRH